MKTLSRTAVIALMTTVVGLGAVAPGFAQDATPAPQAEQRESFRQHRHSGATGVGNFLGFERGAEAIEVAFVRLSHAVDLTAEQQPLFDAFKTAALDAADRFAAATGDLLPTPTAKGQAAALPDIGKRLENRIAFETARLDALKSVQPAATAFFDSLTEAQQAELTPRRFDRDGGPGFGKGGTRHQGLHKGPMGN